MTSLHLRRRVVGALAGLALLAASPAAASEGQLIHKQTRQPVAGASVAIAGVAGIARTGADGRFTWPSPPRPPLVVIVLLPDGRLAKSVHIDAVPALSPLVIEVEPATEDVVVIAGAPPGVDAPPGVAATVMSWREISRRLPANLMQAMENVAGVSAVAEGQGAVPAVRGLARGRTLLLLDGTRLFSERRAGPSVSFIAPESLDRIEVVRGPASVAYGSDVFGGVIALTTRQPPAASRPGARLTLAAGAGTPATRVDAEVSTGIGSRASVIASGRWRDADDYSSPDGTVPNSAWRDHGVFVRATASAGGWWTASWQGDFVGVSGLPRSDTATLRATSPFERSRRSVGTFDRPGLPWLGQLSVRALAGAYRQRLDQDRLAAPGRPRRIDRADLDGSDVQVRVESRTSIGRSRLTAGAELIERRDFHATDTGIQFNAAGAIASTTVSASVASANRRDGGAFAHMSVPVGPVLTLAWGGRVDHVRSTNAGGYFGDRSVAHTAASGSLSAAMRPVSSIIITAQVSSGFRDPTLSDRFYRGPVGRGFIVGNPELRPERSRQFDLAARYDAGRFSAGASVYHYDITDLIERYPSGAETFLFRNRGLGRVQGVEIDARLDARPGLRLEVIAQAGRGRARDDNAWLDDIAPRSLIAQVRHTVGTRGAVAIRLAAVARDARPGPSEVATPGYVEAGGTAHLAIVNWIELRMAASNLLNRRYASSPGPRGVLAPGRHATAAITVRF